MKQYEQLNDMWEAIKVAETIAIFRHVHPDADAYGAQLALAHALHDNFPQKKIFCYGELLTDFAYLYESGTSFFTYAPDEVDGMTTIALDTGNIPRLDIAPLSAVPHVDLKIDHHPDVDHYAVESYVNTTSPATCAILLDYFLFLSQTTPSFTVSTNVYEKLYAGIVGDTGNFRYGNGLNQAFFTNVGVLFEKIDTKKMLNQIFAKTLAEVKFSGLLSERITQVRHFAYVEFTSDLAQEAGVSLNYATSRVNLMQDIRDVRVWATFCEVKTEATIRCSLRSHTLDVAEVAQAFGGGGHRNAAGVRLQTWDEVETLKAVLMAVSNKDK
jgi:phosphoesterase RecJ-like protein